MAGWMITGMTRLTTADGGPNGRGVSRTLAAVNSTGGKPATRYEL